ncbi:MAG: NHL repeat-containing protein [Candidatus Eisenbacteria sp.]|nr:NHL repeat-containing protein [Candidatus Eisenbacteria bacterium]
MWTEWRSHFRRPPSTAVRVVTAVLAAAVVTAALPTRAGDAAVTRPVLSFGRARVVTGLSVRDEVPGTRGLGMSAPEAVAMDHRGNVVIADTGNHRVLIIGRDGTLVDEFGGYGWDEDRLDTPSDVCVYRGFYTYVLDEGNRRVARYDVEGDYIDLVVAEDEAGSPVAMAVGTAGGLFLVDADSQSVLSYSQFDEAMTPVGRFGLDEGGLLAPSDVAAGPSREIAVADPGRFSVEVFDEFGAPLYSLSAPDTLEPRDVAFDARGNVLVIDARHNRVLAFPAGGGPHTTELPGATGFRFTAIAPGAAGELVALDGETGRVQLIEIVYGADASGR